MTALELIALLDGRDLRPKATGPGRWQALCPGHADRKPSLSVSEGQHGRALLHCHAGCSLEAVLGALGLTPSDLFAKSDRDQPAEEAFAYVDAEGVLLMQVVRKSGKQFRQRRPDESGGWIWSIRSVPRVPYRLPKVISAVEAGETIYVAEGEKDVHAIERAGAVATCNAGGAGKWTDEHSKHLAGASVVVIADRDEAGIKHARQVAASLTKVNATVTIVRAAIGKDAHDHLAAGRTLDELEPLEDDARGSSLVIRASDVRSSSVRWAWIGRLAIGYLAVWTGIEGLGKSVFAAWMLARLTRGELSGEWNGTPVDVLIVAGEDGIADTWKPRLDLARADPDRTWSLNLSKLAPDWNLRDGIDQIRAAVKETSARVIFIDAALDHMPAPKAGESINSPTFVRQAMGPWKQAVRELELVGMFSLHPPKARSGEFRDLVQASQAFSAIPRVGLLLAYHPDDSAEDPDRRRVLIRGKGNLGRDPGALEFRIAGRPYRHDDGRTEDREVIADLGLSAVTLADLAPNRMVGEREPTKIEQAAEFIRGQLIDGEWHLAAPILRDLAALELGSGSVTTTAARTARVEKRKRPGETGGPWEWRIKDSSPEPTFHPPPDIEPDGMLESCEPARARCLSDDGILDSSSCNGSNDGKAPTFHTSRPTADNGAKIPSAEGYRARERDRDEGVDEFDADAVLERLQAKFGDLR